MVIIAFFKNIGDIFKSVTTENIKKVLIFTNLISRSLIVQIKSSKTKLTLTSKSKDEFCKDCLKFFSMDI